MPSAGSLTALGSGPDPHWGGLAGLRRFLSAIASSPSVQGAVQAIKHPGEVYAGKADPFDTGQALGLAGLAMTGGLGGAPAGAIGSGPVRALPSDNYTKPLSTYADMLYREVGPGAAREFIDPNLSMGAGLGRREMFFADHPDLALGQGANRGVTIALRPGEMTGQINKKPGWEPLFEQGMAEYRGYPKGNIRDNVTSVRVKNDLSGDKMDLLLLEQALKRLEEQGWSKKPHDDFVEYVRQLRD